MVEVFATLALAFAAGSIQAWWRFGRPRRSTAVVDASRRLRIKRVIQETARAVSVELESSAPFRAGQFLQLRTAENGPWRSYSLSVPPGDSLRITVQEVPGGQVSPRLTRGVRPGDIVEVRGPFGQFTDDGAPELLALAGGSGITPLYAIVQDRLRRATCRTVLVYGSRSPSDTIFLGELRAAAAAWPDRLRLVLLWDTDPDPDGVAGRLDLDGLSAVIAPLAADGSRVMVCGPEPMRTAARTWFSVHRPDLPFVEERFTVPTAVSGTATRATFMGPNGPVRFSVPASQSLLTAARASNVSLPSGCEVGLCGTCRVRVLAGEVETPGRSDRDRADRIALACVGTCTSDTTFELAG